MAGKTLQKLATVPVPSEGELENLVRLSFSHVENRATPDGSPVLLVKTETRVGKNFSARVDPNYVCNLAPAEKEKLRSYVQDVLSKAEGVGARFLDVVRGIGEKNPYVENGRWLIQEEYPHLALALAKNLCEPDPKAPRYTFIVWPDAPIGKGYRGEGYDLILDPEENKGYMFGVSYMGQTKMMGVMSLMHQLREEGVALPVHASSVKITVRKGGKLFSMGVGFSGLSGTGKSTLSYLGIPVDPAQGEEFVVYQDDINYISMKDLEAYASEKNPYMKTDSVEELPLMKPAIYSPYTIYENVELTEDGRKMVLNSKKFPNSRGIFGRQDITNASKGSVNVGKMTVYVAIGRSKFLPPILLCDARQAARVYAVGESVKTAAVGGGTGKEMLRQTGFNPFIYFSPDKDTRMLQQIMEKHPDFQFILLNTGHIGDMKITKEMSRDVLNWYFRAEDPKSECEKLPNGMWMRKADRKFYPDHDKFLVELSDWEADRTQYLKNHPDFKSYAFIQ